MAEWFVKQGGKVSGPFTDNYLSKLKHEGSVTAETLIRKDSGPWTRAETVLDLPSGTPSTEATSQTVPRYSVLSFWSRSLMVAGVLSVLAAVGIFAMAIEDGPNTPASAFLAIFGFVVIGVFLLTASEIVKAIIQVAQDVRRISRK